MKLTVIVSAICLSFILSLSVNAASTANEKFRIYQGSGTNCEGDPGWHTLWASDFNQISDCDSNDPLVDVCKRYEVDFGFEQTDCISYVQLTLSATAQYAWDRAYYCNDTGFMGFACDEWEVADISYFRCSDDWCEYGVGVSITGDLDYLEEFYPSEVIIFRYQYSPTGQRYERQYALGGYSS